MAIGDTNLSSCTLKVNLSSILQKELDGRNAEDSVSQNRTIKLSDGTGAAEVGDQQWSDYRSLATGASESLDLAGVLTNAFGATITFNTIRLLLIENTSTASSLIIDGTVANSWTGFLDANGTITIRPSGSNYPSLLCVSGVDSTGMDVTAGSVDILKLVTTEDEYTPGKNKHYVEGVRVKCMRIPARVDKPRSNLDL